MQQLFNARVTTILALFVAGHLTAQKVGIETTSPDSTLSIQNKLEIGGAQGDLLFTDDLGSITFPSTTAPNAPMIHMFSSGTSNAYRMVLAHSPQYPDWGLEYRDDVDQFRFGVTGSTSAVSIGVGPGHLAVGEVDVSAQSTLIAASTNDITTGHFINTNTSDPSVNAVYGSVSGNGTGIKRGGFFEAFQGSGRAYGVYATSAIADTNIAIYGTVGLISSLPGDINRAAWFDDGDVVVDESMLIGSSALSDIPNASALLELRSTTSGLLLPRMTTTERQSIASPAEGLVVYDTDLSKTYFHDGGNWKAIEGTGGVGGFWTEDPSPGGIFYDGGNVGIGVSSISSSRRLDVQTASDDFAGFFYNNTSSSGTIAGVTASAISGASGEKRGGSFDAQSGQGTNYGVWARALNAGTNIGVYGTASGGETDRAAWFDQGDVVVDEQMLIGSSTFFQEPESSAILELNSTTRGLLLPRMTTTQRNNISPPLGGLIVFDNTADALYLYNGSSWEEVGAGGSGDSPWTENSIGIHYDGANVVVGDDQASFFEQFYTYTDSKQYSGRFTNEFASNLSKYGVLGSVSHHGTGTRIAVYGVGQASSTGTSDTYGVRGEVSGSGASDLYAVYGSASGTTTGNKWAGYFNGNVGVTDHLKVLDGTDASLSSDGYLQTGESDGLNLVFDDNEVLARNNGQGSTLHMQRDTGHISLCALEKGQVAIGIDNLANLPSPEYLLAVDGKGIFEAVRVELSGVWPDYVFSSGYELKPLQTLEEEIKERGHLPGIPSAAEVSEEGIDLGEMQGKMLEKIEELTLYIIEQQKAIEALTSEVRELRAEEKAK